MNPGVRCIYKFGRIIIHTEERIDGNGCSSLIIAHASILVASTNGPVGDTANRSEKHSSAHPAAPRPRVPPAPPAQYVARGRKFPPRASKGRRALPPRAGAGAGGPTWANTVAEVARVQAN